MWNDKKNARRCFLLDKENSGFDIQKGKNISILSKEEKEELEKLQEEMLEYRRSVAPLPINELRELRKKIDEKLEKNRGES